MKRDMDMIRDILTEIEENQNIHGRFILSDNDFGVSGSDQSKVQYHLRLLLDAGFIEGRDRLSINDLDKAVQLDLSTDTGQKNARLVWDSIDKLGPHIHVTRMTWEGHEFLEAVKDDMIWGKTKDALKGVGGVGIDTIKDVAKAVAKSFVKTQAKKHIGIDLDI